MDARHQKIKDGFFAECKRGGMTQAAPSPLLTDDPTVYFASATITPLKQILARGEIPKNNLYLHKQCFRLKYINEPFYNQQKVRYPGYFNMLGTLVHPDNAVSFQENIIQILDSYSIDKDRIKVQASDKESFLTKKLSDVYNVEFNTKKDSSFDWVYGMGNDINGRGIYFNVLQPDGSYKSLGQYIVIKNKDKIIGSEYGIGIEVLLSRKENYKSEYDVFSISTILQQNGLDVNFANTHILSSVAAAYSTGITLDKHPHSNYKKLLNKMLANLLFLKIRDNISDAQIAAILTDFFVVEFGNSDTLISLTNDFRKRELELETQTNQMNAFRTNQKRLGKSEDFINQRIAELYPLYTNYLNTVIKSY
jgi:hypothetical protein